MGIDRPDVEAVVHFEIPGSLEAYYQEIGRGGRDGRRADAILLWNYADVRTREFFIEKEDAEEDPESLTGATQRSLRPLFERAASGPARLTGATGLEEPRSIRSSARESASSTARSSAG